jgi:TorA maturation chaperone TorD/NAD-dependent dihydropyrimidine dehydrogenase PreA subunit
MTVLAADLYHALAGALASEGPPGWLARAGREWPLFEIAAGLAPTSEAARRALESLGAVRAAPRPALQARFASLFAGPGRPRFWLYESAWLNGRLLGPETFAVEKLYRLAGLDVQRAGAELADHASLELAFLAHLAAVEQDTTLPAERQFIEQHAGRWLPNLGRALAGSGDEAYAPVGQLLADWLTERAGASLVSPVTHPINSSPSRLPAVPNPETCTLCGFCVQVCPVRALAIRESASETVLALKAAACVGCGKCERICQTHALEMKQAPKEPQPSAGSWDVLRQSPRAVCRACGEPMVSRAELEFVAAQIGQPAWLDYCLGCRPMILERQR